MAFPHLLLASLGLLLAFGSTSSQSNEIKSYDCLEEGRYADTTDCTSYFECISDQEGSLRVYRRSCHGHAFDPKKKTCVKPKKETSCHVRKGRSFSISKKYDEICENGTLNFACADCGTHITCSEGKASVMLCESDLRCSTNATGFEGGVCHIQYDDDCRCLEANSYRQDPYSPSTFFLCNEADAPPKIYNCPTDMYFDEESNSCLNYDGSPSCTASGIFTYPDNCNKFYMCAYAVEGWIQTKFSCPEGELLNKEKRVCEDPCQWLEKNFTCLSQGRFSDKKDCGMFYECLATNDGNFRMMTRHCLPRLHWNDTTKRCVPVSESKCSAVANVHAEKCLKNFDESVCESRRPRSDLNI